MNRKKMAGRVLTGVMAAVITLTAVMTVPFRAMADSVEKPYLALGADLKKDEKSTVLHLLGIRESDLDDYNVVTVTNQDEHEYLDDYLSADVIGSRALSSVLIEKKEKGNGINVTTNNISYCTEGMYENALATAGVADADVTVAGPFLITGTAALVGAMKAYEDMTGEQIRDIVKDTATNELVLTEQLSEEIGDSSEAEQLIAMLKEYIASHKNPSDEEIEEAINESEKKLNISLTEEQKEKILNLMKKIADLDLDVDQLKEQGKKIYEKLSGLGEKLSDMDENLSGLEETGRGFIDTLKELVDKLIGMLGN